MSATIVIPPFGAMVPDLLRRSFASVKECGIAADTSPRTVERWWRGERLPDAAQWLLMQLNSQAFSAATQHLHDELKQQRTDINDRLERLRASRQGSVVAFERRILDRRERMGREQSGSDTTPVRPSGLTS